MIKKIKTQVLAVGCLECLG